VIKAYVDKQRQTPQKMVEKPKTDGTVDVGGLWTAPDTDGDGGKEKLEGGHFELKLPKKPVAVATAAPGLH
jgi:hypothetical protein